MLRFFLRETRVSALHAGRTFSYQFFEEGCFSSCSRRTQRQVAVRFYCIVLVKMEKKKGKENKRYDAVTRVW